MSYLRAKGVQCYGIGPMVDEEDALKSFGAHSDQERILEEALHKFVQFNWEVVTVSTLNVRITVSGMANFSFSGAAFVSDEPQDCNAMLPMKRGSDSEGKQRVRPPLRTTSPGHEITARSSDALRPALRAFGF